MIYKMLHSQQIQNQVREKLTEITRLLTRSQQYTLREYSTTAVYPNYFRLILSYYDRSGVNAVHECVVTCARQENSDWRIMGMTRLISGEFRYKDDVTQEDVVAELIEKYVVLWLEADNI